MNTKSRLGSKSFFKMLSICIATKIVSRSIWVAALINPLPALGVCLEVRPAMLACKNDFDRMTLATISIQSSIDHLSGKRRLF